jgi:IS5 family transposase
VVKDLLTELRLLLPARTIVDATIIAAPSSKKNATKTRDPEMKQTCKGGSWHFGMRLHIGTDRRGMVHSLPATHAAAAGIKQLPNLLQGVENVLNCDRGEWKEAEDRQAFEKQASEHPVSRYAAGYKQREG